MAEKWADYLISAVRYDSAGTHIDDVQTRLDEGDEVSGPSTWSRERVIERLEEAYTFVTTYRKDGSWQEGAEVRIIEVEGEKYIRSDADEIEEDNLEDLPEF